MEFKTEVEMQSEFIEFLKKQGYPSDTIETERHISSKTAKFSSRLDVAIVVGGKIIQAFELKKDAKTKDIKHTLHQVGMYEEFMDSARVFAEIHIVTYDDGNWWVYSKQNNKWQYAKNILNLANASEEYIKKVKSVLYHINYSKLKDLCQIISAFCLIYFLLYICLSVANSGGNCKYTIPMSWELLALFLGISIVAMLPLLLPMIKRVKIGNLDLELVELEAHQYQRQNSK